jgi:tetratricopeptide (TPR) repeat protein
VADNPRIDELRRRVQKDPASIAFAQLAEEFRRVGEFEEAVRVCRTGLAKHPSYLSARVTLGRALIELQQYDEAHTELDYVLRSAPENLAAIRGLAEIHQRRGELGEALKQYQVALGIAKHDPELEESVQELSRQLGGAIEPRVDVRGAEKPERRPSEVRQPAGQGARAGDTAMPPFAEGDFAIASPQSAPPPPGAVPLALETFEPAADPASIALSPELEAAADEFTRALEALDAITIDVPAPALVSESFDLPPVPLAETDRLVPAQHWEHAEFSASARGPLPDPPAEPGLPQIAIPDAVAPAPLGLTIPGPNADAVADLENWLDNIVLDRGVQR